MDFIELPTICVIEDHDEIRSAIATALEGAGYRVKAYADGGDLLADFDEQRTDAVVSDLHLPTIDGPTLQRRLIERDSDVALVFITGDTDVRTAVQLMEAGAVTILEKPYPPEDLTTAVEKAVARTRHRRQLRHERTIAHRRYALLTDDEKAVLKFIVAGLPNKAIALRLDLSMRTVDRRRSAIMTKLNATSISDLALLLAKVDPETA